MDQNLTYILMIAATIISGFALFKARKPKELGKSWHIPWNAIVFLGLIFLLLLIRHQFTLSNIDFPAR